jgi:hypothetical protein
MARAARKTKIRTGVAGLTDIPNIGPAMAGDLRRLGITRPAQLAGRDPMALYERLARLDGVRHDPCVLDTFMAAVDYMGGAPARPWWKYTPERKALLGGTRKGRG